MVKSPLIRADPEFVKMMRELKRELSPVLNRKPSDRELTRGFKNVFDDAGLFERMIRHEKRRRGRGGLFS